MNKKQLQLGMNPSTASGRLVKDLLFNLVKDTPCFHCGQALTRDTFSIEHKVPWLDSDSPVELFFDIDNITYSHNVCNIKAGRRPHKHAPEQAVEAKLRNLANARKWKEDNRVYDPEERRQRYLRLGT